MKIEWFRSATVGVSSKTGANILCDPWLTNGAFLGSWYHFPKLEGFEFEEVLSRRWDAVYVSHLHADHFDRKFMTAIARNQPECKVLLPSFSHPWLMRAVMNCGFPEKRIIALDSGQHIKVGDIEVRVLTADHCDPEYCGLSSTCHNQDPRLASIDSIAVFEADGTRILNANDALAVGSINQLLPQIGPVDLLMGHFGGAGPFPQCFSDFDESEMATKSEALAEVFLDRLAFAARVTKAKFVMPFAGQYMLAGRLTRLNKWRSVVTLQKAVEKVGSRCDSSVFAIQPFSSFDVVSGQMENPWIEPTEEEVSKYLEELSSVRFPYEKASTRWETASNDLRNALENVALEISRRSAIGIEYNIHRISIETDLVSGFIDVGGGSPRVFVGPLGAMLPQETRIKCHPNLLKGMIKRVPGYKGFTGMHFNQAEIGSHLQWRRNGEYSPATQCLNFLQTVQQKELSFAHTG